LIFSRENELALDKDLNLVADDPPAICQGWICSRIA